MNTKFDIGDDIELCIRGRIVAYQADLSIDCYKIKITNKVDDQSQGTYLFLSSNDMLSMSAKKDGDPEQPPKILLMSEYKNRKKEKGEEDGDE